MISDGNVGDAVDKSSAPQSHPDSRRQDTSARRVSDDAEADRLPKVYANHNDAESITPSFSAWLHDEEEELIAPAVILPWRIALFLFTSTLVQNFSYCMTGFLSIYSTDWTPGEQNQFNQLVFNMIYLGPVFGLVVDVTRVFRERYRPVIIIASLANMVLCIVCFSIPTMNAHYGRSLITEWLMQIAVIFIYMPMNAVVISYGNSILQSPEESSARIGGLMAQAMVARSLGTLVYQFVYVFARPRITTQPDRWMLLIAFIGSAILIIQVLLPLTMKRSYFVDRREASLKHSAPVRFYWSVIRARRNAVSRRRKATNTSFMFILCFIFIYFMLPDTLYNTMFSFNSQVSVGFSKGLTQAISILSSLGALLGSVAYALWMYLAHEHERKHHRLAKTNPFQIVLAGCCAWGLGCFVHLIGVSCFEAKHFSWKVFIPFQAIIVQACLRFAFMPTLSLAAMHAPQGYETTAFELYSVDTTGGGVVSSSVTKTLMQSMGVTKIVDVTNSSGAIKSIEVTMWNKYWQVALICIFFQFLPMLIAVSLPKHRDADTPVTSSGETEENEPLRESNEEMKA